MRHIATAVGLSIVGLVAVALVVDEGEVVTLTTRDGDGRAHETALWIVEVEGDLYLRGARGRAWVERLADQPRITLQRNGSRGDYRAVPVESPARGSAVDRQMAAKYGIADRLSGWVDRARRVAIRLEPVAH